MPPHYKLVQELDSAADHWQQGGGAWQVEMARRPFQGRPASA